MTIRQIASDTERLKLPDKAAEDGAAITFGFRWLARKTSVFVLLPNLQRIPDDRLTATLIVESWIGCLVK